MSYEQPNERAVSFATRWVLALCIFTSIVLLASLYWMASNAVLEMVGRPRLLTSLADEIARLEDVETLRKVCVPLAQAMESTERVRADAAGFVRVSAGFLIVVSGIGFLLSTRLLRLLVGSGANQSAPEGGPADRLFGFLLRALSGKIRLWMAFWLIYVLPPLIYLFLAWILKGAFSMASSLSGLLVVSLVMAAIAVQLIFSMVVVWRSAANADKRIWGILARGVIVLHSLYLAGSVGVAAWTLGKLYLPFLLQGA